MPSSLAPLTPPPRSRTSLLLVALACPVLLAVSFYGFWKWAQIINVPHVLGNGELAYMINLVILPLLLLVLLVFLSLQNLSHHKLCISYQSRVDLLQTRLNVQEEFLHTLTDLAPEPVAIFDKNDRYWFLNLAAARRLNAEAGDVVGKPLAKVLAPAQAEKVTARLSQVRASGQPIDSLEQLEDDQGQMQYIQVQYKPVPPFGNFAGGVMVREDNVTSLITERERREAMLRQLTSTLIAVVDRRDPYAAGHSARVGQLARVIAEEMMLGEKDIEAAEIAGSIMNFGKVLVARHILTKTTALTADELQRVRESILTSAEILSLIDFGVPVIATLKQVLERYDGSGAPRGLKGDEIIVTARIVTVSNAFVALVSPRAHRPSLDSREALGNLMRDADAVYDRRVVTALINYIDNRPNKLDWLAGTKQI